MAFKSDVEVKQKFIEKLLKEGFDTAEVKAKPADIMAQKNGVTWYYEIKLTDHDDTCFGAATLTEWEQALKTPYDRYQSLSYLFSLRVPVSAPSEVPKL
jgi:hypothetical protein